MTDFQTSTSGLGYRRTGRGSTTVLLLHGIPGSGRVWDATAGVLAEEFDVIVPDLLGFGASIRPTSLDELHVAAQATALDHLLVELDVRSAVVVGHDFGGPVAVTLSARRPQVVSALGLVATNVLTDTPIPFPLSTVNWPVLGAVTRRLFFSRPSLRMMLRQGVGRGAPSLDESTHLGDRAQQRAIATIFSGSLTRLTELYAPVEQQLRRLEMPVFVGWGDRDPFFSVEQGRRVAEAAEVDLRVYDGAGHFLPHERPTELAADIARLASTVASTTVERERARVRCRGTDTARDRGL